MRASSSITQFQLGKAVRNTELEKHPFVTLNNGPSWRPSVVLKPPQSADPPEQHGNAATAQGILPGLIGWEVLSPAYGAVVLCQKGNLT